MLPNQFPTSTKRCLVFFALILSIASGCMSPWFAKRKTTRTEEGELRDEIRKKLVADDRPRMIAEVAGPAMLTQSRIENIGLITQLRGTGGSVQASSQREKILDMMRRKDAAQPNAFLDSPSTALGIATAIVPPASPAGTKLDILVTKSSHADATDLEHGWLMETPLTEMSVLDGRIREGFDLARVKGYIVTEAQITGDQSEEAKLQGVVVGGGRLLKGRDLGLSVDAEYADAITLNAIVPAINQRFTYFDGQKRSGVATPRDSGYNNAGYVEIKIPPRYRLDPFHYINVISHIGILESEAQRQARIATLQKQLLDPTTAREAAWQLEAIGDSTVPMLAEALNHPDPEIAFYSAHSLAYLNQKQAIPKLKSLCLREPAFRAMCFNGLALIEHFDAGDTLNELLHAADPEVKYGAVRALRKRDPNAAAVRGEVTEDVGSILEIPSSGPPLVAVSLNRTPEVVLFGTTPTLHIPSFQYVNERTMVSPSGDGKLKVSYFSPGEEDKIIECDADIRSVLNAIAEVGGTFGDWVKFLRECHDQGYFIEPFAINPIPVSGRTYDRNSKLDTPNIEQELIESTYIDPEIAGADEESAKSLWNPLTWGK
ncbi:MAG: HEAT repeat domain-containing protein [Planctomycetota bacterium]